MNLQSFVQRNLPYADELIKMLADPSVGRSIGMLPATSQLNSRELRRLIAKYANSAAGPFGERRLALYHQVHDLFEQLKNKVPLPHLKGYELKDSFLGGDEADLIMLMCSHASRSQESIAQDTLLCSKNAVGDRRRKIADGVRIAGMCIQTDFGYRGSFTSSVHPVALPLNLSEAYVLVNALKQYEVACGRDNPHGAIAGRIANMVYSELSDYARSKLSPRFTDSGYQFEHVDPLFEEDSSKSARWVYFEKAGVPITATLASGEKLTGTIVPMAGQKGRAHLTIRKEDGTCARVPWADVITIDPAEPAPRDA